MTTDMSGQVALVTGGVRGIGLAICERLIGRSVIVSAGYLHPSDASAAFLADHSASGASIHQGDVGLNVDCERVVREVIEGHGRLDILVNNAGIAMDHTVRKMSPEEWDDVLRVNLHGAFYMCRAAVPHMIQQGYGPL